MSYDPNAFSFYDDSKSPTVDHFDANRSIQGVPQYSQRESQSSQDKDQYSYPSDEYPQRIGNDYSQYPGHHQRQEGHYLDDTFPGSDPSADVNQLVSDFANMESCFSPDSSDFTESHPASAVAPQQQQGQVSQWSYTNSAAASSSYSAMSEHPAGSIESHNSAGHENLCPYVFKRQSSDGSQLLSTAHKSFWEAFEELRKERKDFLRVGGKKAAKDFEKQSSITYTGDKAGWPLEVKVGNLPLCDGVRSDWHRPSTASWGFASTCKAALFKIPRRSRKVVGSFSPTEIENTSYPAARGQAVGQVASSQKGRYTHSPTTMLGHRSGGKVWKENQRRQCTPLMRLASKNWSSGRR